MMKRISLAFLFFSFIVNAQIISGTVVSEESFPIRNVLVVNTVNNSKTYTNSQGQFSIEGKENDELRFLKNRYDRKSIKLIQLTDLKVTLVRTPHEIEKVVIMKLTGDLNKDSKRIRVDGSNEKLKKVIGLPIPKGKQREKIPTVTKDIVLPLLAGTLNVDALYKIVSGEAKKSKRRYEYQDLQDNIRWIRERAGDGYFEESNIPKERINEFLAFAIKSNPNIVSSIKSNKFEKISLELYGLMEEYLSRLNTKPKLK